MKLSFIVGTACAFAVLTTVNAQAATLAAFPFTGLSLASTDTNAVSAAGDIALDTGLTDAVSLRFSAAGNPGAALRVNSDETGGTSFPTANVANDDFTFSITPISGGALELTTLTFDLAVSAATVSSNVRLQLGTNGTTFVTLDSITDFTTTSFTAESFSLSAANAALTTGLPIYIRFLVFDGANSATAFTAFDNITVTGAVTALVPEPGTNALLALGAVATVGGIMRPRATA